MTIPRGALISTALLLFWLLPLFSSSAGGAQSSWFARGWQSDDGLPDNNVTGVVQTSDGYLWVATQGGLARFDGIQFKRISLPVISAMPVEMIRALTVTAGDHLWLALEGGVAVSAAPHETKVYTAADGLPVVRPTSITKDAKGAIWAGYSDGSICCIAGDPAEHAKGKLWPPGAGWCWLAADSKGQLWFAKAGHVGILRDGQFLSLVTMPERSACIATRRKGGMWICAGRSLFTLEEGHPLAKAADLARAGEIIEPLVIDEDDSAAVWVGTTAHGLFHYDGSKVARAEISHGEVRSVTEDREGNIWVGTSGGGLNRLRPRALRLEGVENGLPFETVRSVCEDTSGALWAVTQNGFLARSRGESWSVVSTNADWPGGQASCVAGDARSGIWIGTITNGLYRWKDGHYTVLHKSDGLAGDRLWTLMADSADNLWIAVGGPNCVQRLHQGKLEKFELPPGSLVVRAMVEDAAHVIWMGTEDGRLLRFEGTNLVDETQRTLARSVPIRCLQGTADSSLWIGYAGAGLGRFKAGQFSRIGTEQGLPDDFISQIEADGQGTLWFAGNRGVFEIKQTELDQASEGRLEKVRAVLFGKNEGLPSLQANFGFGLGSVRARDGRICFSMLTGLLIVAPGKIQDNRLPPPVRIERVNMDGRTLPVPGTSQLPDKDLIVTDPAQPELPLIVPPQHHALGFEFSALSFAAPENIRFRYQLEGYDPHWVETSQRSAAYSRIPAGPYRFRVKACNNSGTWNETGAVLALIVQPFFWQTWWFRLVMIATFTAGLIGMGWYISTRRLRRKLLRLEQESALQKDRARIAKDLHDDLGANLSQIAMLSELARTDLEKPPLALSHLDQIFHTARLITRSLDEIVWAINPRNDTLDRFVAHMCQFAPEFLRAAGIRCRLDMPIDLPFLKLAANVRHQLYLGMKEALHNIIKHAEATEVWLRLVITPEMITLVVEDNGRGFETSDAPRTGEDGLINLRHRMEEIGGRFEHHSGTARGTRLVFVAPLQGRTA